MRDIRDMKIGNPELDSLTQFISFLCSYVLVMTSLPLCLLGRVDTVVDTSSHHWRCLLAYWCAKDLPSRRKRKVSEHVIADAAPSYFSQSAEAGISNGKERHPAAITTMCPLSLQEMEGGKGDILPNPSPIHQNLEPALFPCNTEVRKDTLFKQVQIKALFLISSKDHSIPICNNNKN